MPVNLVSAGGGTTTLTPASSASNYTLTLPAGTGTITVNGASSNIVQSTAVATTSGTTVVLSTSIPSWAKRITVMVMGLSTTGSSQIMVQLGTAGGYQASSYQGASNDGGTPSSYTNGFSFAPGVAGTTTWAGNMIICNANGNTWTESHVIAGANNNYLGYGGGQIALSGTCTSIRLATLNGTDTFDAGSVNILYE